MLKTLHLIIIILEMVMMVLVMMNMIMKEVEKMQTVRLKTILADRPPINHLVILKIIQNIQKK